MARTKQKSEFVSSAGTVFEFVKAISDEVRKLGGGDDDLRKVMSQPSLAKSIAGAIMGQNKPIAEFYTLLSDDEAVAWIVERAGKSEEEARQIVNGFRKKARKQGVDDDIKIHVEVQPGCAFKQNVPRMGPCWEDFQYLQEWDFPDPPTEHCLVSWIPVPLEGSTNKNVNEQLELIDSFKNEAKLPSWYKVSFGSLNHVAGLTLAHFAAMGEDPFADLIVRTDSCNVVGHRLWLGWHEGRLYCDYWNWDDDRISGFAVFAAGVVKALGR